MSATFTQARRPLQLTTPLGEDALLLRGFHGREELSQPFRFTLDMLSKRADIKPNEIVGQDVTFSIDTVAGETRHFHGYVSQMAYLGHGDRLEMYSATVVPWLWFLTRRSNCRIFQEKTALQIIQQVVDDAGFGGDLQIDVQETPPQQTYIVQYRETDLNFISRLMEHNGLFYFFKFEDGRHTMVVSDHKRVHDRAVGDGIKFQQSLSKTELERGILDWNHNYQYRSGRWVHTDYNFQTPQLSLEETVTTEASKQLKNTDKNEYFDYPGEFADRDESKRHLKQRMEEEEVGFDIVNGVSTYREFGAGQTFELEEHNAGTHELKTYLLLGVHHRADLGGSFLTEESEGVHRIYENTFTCIPDDVPYRPARTTPRPTIPGIQTAVVTGPSGEEIYTDEYGRIKVQFHWDREGRSDENSSCWMRHATPWAGEQFGLFHIPRIGQEVVISFLEGNPDRPLITGMVHNADNMPALPLPEYKDASGIITRSTKNGERANANGIVFVDKKNEEAIHLRAEKNMLREVENNDSIRIGFDDKDPGEQTFELWGDRTETIETGNESLRIKQGSRDETLDAGDDSVRLRRGSREIKIDLGSHTTTAMQSIKLEVGQSSIELTQSGITISAPTITLNSQMKTTIGSSGITEVQGSLVKIN